MKFRRKKHFRLLSLFLALSAAFALANTNGIAAAATTKKKTVILYFSATGTTKKTAAKIKKSTNGQLIEIKAKDPYTDADLDWTNDDSRVTEEHESASSPARSKVRPEIRNLSAIKKAVKKADIVYIGYAGGIIGLN